MMISFRTVPSSVALTVCALIVPCAVRASSRPVSTALRETPATAFRHWVGLGSIYGAIGFMAVRWIADWTRGPDPQLFLTNIFPGNWRIRRFISRLSRATETAELGRPLL